MGKVPKSRLRDEAGRALDLLIVDRRSKGLRDVVAFIVPQEKRLLETGKGTAEAVNSVPDGPSRPPDSPSRAVVEIDQIEHTFELHLVAVRSGQVIRFTNSDPANHNVRASSLQAKNQFNIFTGGGGQYDHRFFLDKKKSACAVRVRFARLDAGLDLCFRPPLLFGHRCQGPVPD